MKKKIYCVYCGEKNNIKDLKCKKCKKKLNPKENMLLDYIKDHIKDDVEGNIFDIIKKFIISHLYGTFLTATLIFTIVSGIVTINNDEKIIEVAEKPIILLDSLNRCNIPNSIETIKICNDGYILEDEICKKEEEHDATINKNCPSNYYLSGNRCISNNNYDKLSKEECIAPSGDNVIGASVQDGTCLVEYCVGWTDGVCSAGSVEPIDFTINYYCPSGTTLINGVCKKTTNYETVYSCDEGTLKEDKCIILKEEDTKVGCSEGYILNEECNICTLGE